MATKDHFSFNTLTWILLILVFVGVTYFAPYFLEMHSSYRVIKHDLDEANTLTLDGSKRSIIVKDGFMCAEPSPDAASTIATSIAVSAAAARDDDKGSIDFGVLTDPRTQALFRRTQGIQAIRDGMFRLCEARMNNAVDQDFYEEQMTDLLLTLNFIVPLELCINASTKMGEHMNGKTAASDSAPNAKVRDPDVVVTYMSFCMNVSKDYGLTLAENASQTRHNRRILEHEKWKEEFQINAFRDSQ